MSERLPPASEPSGDAQGARHPHASHGGSRTLRRLCPGSGAPSKCSACKHMRGSGAVGLLCGTLRRRYTSETELQLTRAISIIRSCSEHERLGSRVCAGSMLVQARGRSVVAAMDSRTQRRGRSVVAAMESRTQRDETCTEPQHAIANGLLVGRIVQRAEGAPEGRGKWRSPGPAAARPGRP